LAQAIFGNLVQLDLRVSAAGPKTAAMVRATGFLALGLATVLGGASAGRLGVQPTAKHIDLDTIYGSLASLEKAEFRLISQVFVLAQRELARARANATRVNASRVTVASGAGAPAGAPGGAPGSLGPEGGDRIPATGPKWTPPAHLAALTPDLKGTALPKFVPLCAAKLEEMVEKKAAYLAMHGASNDTIGLSMATHFQVVCEGAFPVKEQQCDDTSVDLAKLIEGGKPLNPLPAGPAGAPGAPGAPALVQLRARVPRAAAPAGAPGGAPGGPGGPTDSGPGWCTAFFNMYFDAVIAANAGGAPAR